MLYVRAQIINVLFKYIFFKNKDSCPSVGPVGSDGGMLLNNYPNFHCEHFNSENKKVKQLKNLKHESPGIPEHSVYSEMLFSSQHLQSVFISVTVALVFVSTEPV